MHKRDTGVTLVPAEVTWKSEAPLLTVSVVSESFGTFRRHVGSAPVAGVVRDPTTLDVASLTWQADPDIETGPIMAAYSPPESFLNAARPGLVAPDFTGFQGPRGPATAIRLATLPDDGGEGAASSGGGPACLWGRFLGTPEPRWSSEHGSK